MKRSEAQQHIAARNAWSAQYTCLSVKTFDNGEQAEPYFSHNGCDVCANLPSGGAGTVYAVTYLLVTDTDNETFDAKAHVGQLCGSCLCSLVNADDSDLDFGVTDENA